MQQVKHLADLGYTIVAEPEEHSVSYEIYEVTGTCEDGAPVYQNLDLGFVYTVQDADPLLKVFVKWDGCATWSFVDDPHTCEREGVRKLCAVMETCYEWTAELCQHWSQT